MAFVSFGLNRGADDQPDKIALGTDDGGAGNDITLCINQAAGLTRQEVVLACEAMIRKLEDGRYAGIAGV